MHGEIDGNHRIERIAGALTEHSKRMCCSIDGRRGSVSGKRRRDRNPCPVGKVGQRNDPYRIATTRSLHDTGKSTTGLERATATRSAERGTEHDGRKIIGSDRSRPRDLDPRHTASLSDSVSRWRATCSKANRPVETVRS